MYKPLAIDLIFCDFFLPGIILLYPLIFRWVKFSKNFMALV